MIKAKTFKFSNFYLNSTEYFITFILLLSILVLDLQYLFYAGYVNPDEFEHIHSSYKVWSGEIPYRDFFQHHNPLLWYIFAPITGLFYENANVFFAARLCSFVANISCFVFLYKIITRFIGSFPIFILTFTCITMIDDFSRDFIEFRPDSFMNLCFLSGFYYYLRYFEKKELKFLIISFTLFTLSFFFLQKILLLLFFLGLYTLYLAYKNKITIEDILKASIIPTLMITSFILWLYHYDMLALYWQLNVTLNSYIPQHYGLHNFPIRISGTLYNLPLINGYASVYKPLSVIIPSVLIIFYFRNFLKKNSITRQAIVVVFFSELAIRLFTFSPYPHYYQLFYALAAVILFTIFYQNPSAKKHYAYCAFCLIATLSFITQNYNVYNYNTFDFVKRYTTEAQFVIDNTTKDDVVLNGSEYNYNLFRKDADWLWYQLNDIGYIYDLHFNTNRYDVNTTIKNKLPKVIYATDYISTPYNKRRSRILNSYNFDILYLLSQYPDSKLNAQDLIVKIPQVTTHKLDREFIEEHYKPTGISEFWILKDKTD